MRIKIIKIDVNDLIFDYKIVSEIINRRCFINGTAINIVRGVVLRGKSLFVWLEKVTYNMEKDIFVSYTFSKINGISDDDIIAEIKWRSYYGFSTIGIFEIDNDIWGLFGKRK